jgi:hypothetical protein
MKPILSSLLCALSLGLSGCSEFNSLGRINLVADNDTTFMVVCAGDACAQKASETCKAQGYSRYDIVDQTQGDDLGEARGVVIQCKA